MTNYVERAGLKVDAALAAFVEDRALPGLEIGAEALWQGLSDLVHDFAPRNRELLARREELQEKIDAWHRARTGQPHDAAAYKAFLEEIGYLLPEGEDFRIDTSNVDPEIAAQPGPQLVVPIMNARYALNAANARWGSLYDALYGTDVLGNLPTAKGYDPERGARVVAWAKGFLDDVVPLAEGSWADVTALSVAGGRLSPALADASHFAGHVGADAAAATLAEGPHRQDKMMLLVDVGTNAEIVLGNSKRVVAASSPTGPAFEGAEISSGQRAAPGAIERVRIDPETLEPRFKIIGSDLWSNEEGFAESVRTGITGICGSGIIEVVAEMYLAGVISEDGVVDGSLAARSPRVVANGRTFSYVLHDGDPLITVTQNDVRAIQLAKAALYAGIKLLMDKQGVDRVDQIRFAGAFGSFIDPKYAMVLGLIPDCDLAKVSAVGNAAGTGARMALVNRDYRREIEKTVRAIEKIETALEPKFQEHFVAAMALPNKTAPFPELAKAVKLPPRRTLAANDDGSTPGRRRREGGRRARG